MDYTMMILDGLKMMRSEEIKNKAMFKVRAYNTAIKAITENGKPINNDSDVAHVIGLTEKMKTKVVDIMHNEELLNKFKENKESLEAIDAFTKIMAVGEVKARELVEKHGVQTIDALRQRTDLLNDKQKMGLKHYDDFLLRIPRKEMDKHNAFLKTIMDKHLVRFELAGSYRRGLSTSGDIDVLITCDREDPEVFDRIVKDLKTAKYLSDDFAYGKEKYLGTAKLPRHKHYRRIDLLYIPKDKFAFALLYFTGSQEFNIRMRNIALEKGLSLSEHGFKYTSGAKKGEFVTSPTFRTEQDIFKHLDMDYVDPRARK